VRHESQVAAPVCGGGLPRREYLHYSALAAVDDQFAARHGDRVHRDQAVFVVRAADHLVTAAVTATMHRQRRLGRTAMFDSGHRRPLDPGEPSDAAGWG
jgi:hypothetical protein